MIKPIPGYFFPLLSHEDTATPPMLEAYFDHLRTAPLESRETLVYVHVPFCRSHCTFCGYYRQTSQRDENLLKSYVDRVLAELDVWEETGLLRFAQVKAVYIGGGTPSLLSPDLAGRLLDGLRAKLALPPQIELSFEGEPSTLKDETLLSTLREHQVTRCSFGVQSFDPNVRQLCHIGASLSDVEECILALRRFNYPICLDLMYGLPGQTVANFLNDLTRAIDVEGASLIDLYPTVLYPSAPLYRADRHARSQLPKDDERERMYDGAIEHFAQRGFHQYTFEDFCLPGSEYLMKHLTYGGFDGRAQTLALGACAVGYLGGCAYRNEVLEHYSEAAIDCAPIALLHQASLDEQRRRALFFYPRRLRLDPARLAFPLSDVERQELDRHVALGLAERTPDGTIALTRLGRSHADEMISDTLSTEERRKLFRLVQ